jgi:hypothetical protein
MGIWSCIMGYFNGIEYNYVVFVVFLKLDYWIVNSVLDMACHVWKIGESMSRLNCGRHEGTNPQEKCIWQNQFCDFHLKWEIYPEMAVGYGCKTLGWFLSRTFTGTGRYSTDIQLTFTTTGGSEWWGHRRPRDVGTLRGATMGAVP